MSNKVFLIESTGCGAVPVADMKTAISEYSSKISSLCTILSMTGHLQLKRRMRIGDAETLLLDQNAVEAKFDGMADSIVAVTAITDDDGDILGTVQLRYKEVETDSNCPGDLLVDPEILFALTTDVYPAFSQAGVSYKDTYLEILSRARRLSLKYAGYDWEEKGDFIDVMEHEAQEFVDQRFSHRLRDAAWEKYSTGNGRAACFDVMDRIIANNGIPCKELASKLQWDEGLVYGYAMQLAKDGFIQMVGEDNSCFVDFSVLDK